MGLSEAFSGSDSSYSAGNGDLTGVVSSGSTYAMLLFKNTSDVPIKVHYRQTGTSDDANVDLTPGEYSGDITIALTSARTIDYYIEGGGSITCYVVHYWGTGLAVSSVAVADIRTKLLISGYSTDDIPDASIQEMIDEITGEVNDAAARHLLIAGFALNTTVQTNAIKMGATWLTLTALRNLGASQGLQAQRVIVSSDSLDDFKLKYTGMLERIRSGIVYGGN